MMICNSGISYDTIPTAVYKATSPDGQSYRIDVSFISDQDHFTSNVSEVVWRWMQEPSSMWSSIQRISPWEQDATKTLQWDLAVLAALDIKINKQQITKARKL